MIPRTAIEGLMSYKEVARVDLVDGMGAALSIIVETNGPSFKLFARHKSRKGVVSDSNWWSFVDKDRALKEQKDKVNEAVDQGWKEQLRIE